MTEQERLDRLVIRRMMPATREAVFAAWTDPESMREWMCPGDAVTAEAELDLRVGGSFRIIMKSPTRAYDHTGEYLVVEPPSKLAFTWISKGTDNQPTIVTVELFERGNECELVLTHERFPTADAVRRHRSGWGQIADRLAEHLRQRAGVRRAQTNLKGGPHGGAS
ncbi:MAG TPA: SRPBCC domain-containing protein [bacterium]|nr:SRPBCC domain-containing protein [bacterium]